MRNFKTLIFTFILLTGIIIPSCDDDLDCSFNEFPAFFDIKGLEANFYSSLEKFSIYDEIQGDIVSVGDTIPFTELDKFHVYGDVDFVADIHKTDNWSFSLIPEAISCSPPIQGAAGSKEESLMSFSIVTLNDYDQDHLANTEINDLFDFHGSVIEYWDTPIPLEQYIMEQNGLLDYPDMVLKLKSPPELNTEIKFRVELELSTGERYEVTSESIYVE